ncbi:MAG: FAD-dependent oxidoreductase, partial [Clostridia bacterium]|nr:FAD-dependent oxidoreductase [Clostridia bacterium]
MAGLQPGFTNFLLHYPPEALMRFEAGSYDICVVGAGHAGAEAASAAARLGF